MTRTMGTPGRFAFAAGALAVGAAVAWWPKTPSIDSLAYRFMAERPLAPLPDEFAVYGARRLVPTIVSVLPTSVPTGFKLVTIAGLVAAVYLLWRLLLELTDERRSWLGVALFVCSPATSTVVRNPELVDAPLYACLAGGLYAAVARRWWAVVPFVIAAPLVKEPGWLLLPTVVLVVLVRRDRSAVVPMAVAAAGAATAVAVLYHSNLVYAVAGSAPVTGFESLDLVRRSASIPKAIVSSTVLSWGPVWAAAIAGLVVTRSREVRAVAVLAPLLMLGLVTTPEWIRLLALAFPAVLAAACALPWRRAPAMLAFAAIYAALMIVGRSDAAGTAAKYAAELVLMAAGAGVCVLEVVAGARERESAAA